MENMKIHGVKGAITVQDNSTEAIMQASTELLKELIHRNKIDQEDVAAVFFTTSPDLTAEFPLSLIHISEPTRLGISRMPSSA